MSSEENEKLTSNGEGQSTHEKPDLAKHAGKQQKKKSKKLAIIGVVVVVIVAIGVGFNVWHNQPSFCNSICHTPMNFYVQSYYDDQTTLASTHQKSNVTCLQCHEATLSEQINEATAWVSGSYKTQNNGQLKYNLVTADKNSCIKSGCHNWDDVLNSTQNWGGQKGVNPHSSHQGEAIDCSNCHGVHTQSIMYCNTCHDYKVPSGWASPTKTNISN